MEVANASRGKLLYTEHQRSIEDQEQGGSHCYFLTAGMGTMQPLWSLSLPIGLARNEECRGPAVADGPHIPHP